METSNTTHKTNSPTALNTKEQKFYEGGTDSPGPFSGLTIKEIIRRILK